MSFSEILGQQTAKRFLKQVMTSGKIPHAYLFTGIPGIGKTATAMAFAMALSCREPDDFEGCGHCSSCRQFKGDNFPDFLSILPDGQNIRISQIKELNRKLSFAPVTGGYRVCVIHQAEAMNDEAANSFLKTLEEPPPRNILILKATEHLDLLPTIVSRCQQVPFQPLPGREIKDWLLKKREIAPEAAALLARISAGSLGRALKMHDSDFLEKRTTWISRLMELPDFSRDEALNVALECANEDRKKGLDLAASGEAGMQDMLSVWANWFRDLLILKVGGPTDMLINSDFSNKLQNIFESYKVNNLIDSIMTVNQAQTDIRRMRNSILVMEHTILGLHKLAGGRNKKRRTAHGARHTV